MEGNKYIPVIDLFAGPGGLSEGFSSLQNSDKTKCFKVCLSFESDVHAHKTLELRSFFRQFLNSDDKIPKDYYDYLRGEIIREELFGRHPKQADKAKMEAILITLGKDSNESKVDDWIRKAINSGDSIRDLWVLIGGPPCQAYSLAGRSRNKGIKNYEAEKDDRHFLYKEYLRIISKHWPSVFIMENVKGLLSAKVNQEYIFKNILKDLDNPACALGQRKGKTYRYRIYSLSKNTRFGRNGFKLNDFVVNSEQYGIPQARHRIFLLGVREDLDNGDPDTLSPCKVIPTVADVLEGLPKIRSGLSKEKDTGEKWAERIKDTRKKTRWLNTSKKEEKGGQKVYNKIINVLDSISVPPYDKGGEFVKGSFKSKFKSKWYFDWRMRGVCNHTGRGHMNKDLHRYLFASCFASVHGRSPLLREFPKDLLPKHNNVKRAMKNDNFSDRFRVQTFNKPASTITSHIRKDGHYFIHPDPKQCRSLSVREAARIQTFPDNYFFEGPRTQQYKQVGNAVPPLLAKQIAEIVFKIVNQNINTE